MKFNNPQLVATSSIGLRVQINRLHRASISVSQSTQQHRSSFVTGISALGDDSVYNEAVRSETGLLAVTGPFHRSVSRPIITLYVVRNTVSSQSSNDH